MNATLIVGFLGLLIGAGIYLLVFKPTLSGDLLKRLQKGQINKNLAKGVTSAQKGRNVLSGTQYFIDQRIYRMYRYGATVFCFAAGLYAKAPTLIIIGITLFAVTTPMETTKSGKKLPFFYFVESVRKSEREKKDEELMRHVSLLRNMLIQQQHNPIGADYIIDYISSDAKMTRPAYLKFLNKLRLAKVQEAGDAFIHEIGTEFSKEMASLLMQLDRLPPEDLESTIISKQRYVIEVKTTKMLKKSEALSDVIYVPALGVMLIAIFDFLVITFWYKYYDALTFFF